MLTAVIKAKMQNNNIQLVHKLPSLTKFVYKCSCLRHVLCGVFLSLTSPKKTFNMYSTNISSNTFSLTKTFTWSLQPFYCNLRIIITKRLSQYKVIVTTFCLGTAHFYFSFAHPPKITISISQTSNK